jgi:CheY-like chemotaxis protein
MTRTMLCVEHDAASRKVLAEMLENLGYTVQFAGTASEALHMLAESGFDGVLLEYDLPDETGANLRSYIKTLWPEVPVLLFAGVGPQTPYMMRFFDAYLRKHSVPTADPLQDLVG